MRGKVREFAPQECVRSAHKIPTRLRKRTTIVLKTKHLPFNPQLLLLQVTNKYLYLFHQRQWPDAIEHCVLASRLQPTA